MAGVGDIITFVETGITIAKEIKKFYDTVQEAEGALGNLIDDLSEVQDIAKQLQLDISGGIDRKLSPKGDSLVKNCKRDINSVIGQLEHLRPKGKITFLTKVEYWWRLSSLDVCHDLTQKLYTRLQVLYTIFKKEPGWQKEATQYVEEFARLKRRRLKQRSMRTNTGFDPDYRPGEPPGMPSPTHTQPIPNRGSIYPGGLEVIDIDALKDFEEKAFKRGRARERTEREEREQTRRDIIAEYEAERVQKDQQHKLELEKFQLERIEDQNTKEAQKQALFDEWSKAMKSASKSQGGGVARGVSRILAKLSPNSNFASVQSGSAGRSDSASSVSSSRTRRGYQASRYREPKSFAEMVERGSALALIKEDFRPWLEEYMNSLYIYLVDRSGEIISVDEIDRFGVIEYISNKTKRKPAITAQTMSKMPSWLRASVMLSVMQIRKKLRSPKLEILWCEPMPGKRPWNVLRPMGQIRGAFVVLAERDIDRLHDSRNDRGNPSSRRPSPNAIRRGDGNGDGFQYAFSFDDDRSPPGRNLSNTRYPSRHDLHRQYNNPFPYYGHYPNRADYDRHDRENDRPQHYRDGYRPTFYKVNQRHIDAATLDFFGYPYSLDPQDPQHYIIETELSDSQLQQLFFHTAQLHRWRGRRSRERAESPDSSTSFYPSKRRPYKDRTTRDYHDRLLGRERGYSKVDHFNVSRKAERDTRRFPESMSRPRRSSSSDSHPAPVINIYNDYPDRRRSTQYSKDHDEARELELKHKYETEREYERRRAWERQGRAQRAKMEMQDYIPQSDDLYRKMPSRSATFMDRKSGTDMAWKLPAAATVFDADEIVVEEDDDLELIEDVERDPKRFFESLTIDVGEEKEKEKEGNAKDLLEVVSSGKKDAAAPTDAPESALPVASESNVQVTVVPPSLGQESDQGVTFQAARVESEHGQSKDDY